MPSSGMLRRVALVRNDVSGELGAPSIRVTRIGELGTTLAVTSNRRTLHRLLVTASVVPSTLILVTLMEEALSSSETSVLIRATRRTIPEDATLLCRSMIRKRATFMSKKLQGKPSARRQCRQGLKTNVDTSRKWTGSRVICDNTESQNPTRSAPHSEVHLSIHRVC
jgi:hypothetical protein